MKQILITTIFLSALPALAQEPKPAAQTPTPVAKVNLPDALKMEMLTMQRDMRTREVNGRDFATLLQQNETAYKQLQADYAAKKTVAAAVCDKAKQVLDESALTCIDKKEEAKK